MSDIRRARAMISKATALLNEALPLLYRESPTRKAPSSAASLNAKTAKAILQYSIKHPSMPYRDIGARFKVDGGRVSEIVTGKRTYK